MEVSSSFKNQGRVSFRDYSQHTETTEEPKHAKVTFILADDEQNQENPFSSHSSVLKNQSPVFEALFAGEWGQKFLIEVNGVHEFQVKLTGVNTNAFKIFLEFICIGSLNISRNSSLALILEVLEIADKYEHAELVQICEELIISKVVCHNAIGIYQEVACFYNLPILKEVALDVMARCFNKLVKYTSFVNIKEETLLELLPRDDLYITEVDLFEAMLRWANAVRSQVVSKITPELSNNKMENEQRRILKNILPFIRFPLMSPNDFTKIVVPANVLSLAEVEAIYKYSDAFKSKTNYTASKNLILNCGFSDIPRENGLTNHEDERLVLDLDLNTGGNANVTSLKLNNEDMIIPPFGSATIFTYRVGSCDQCYC